MALPGDLVRELAFLNKKKAQLMNWALKRDHGDDFIFELAELISGLTHFLDKLMNVVWEKYNDAPAGRGKPSVYFPASVSIERFEQRLYQLQLGSLSNSNTELYLIIRDSQSFQSDYLLQQMREISNLKHERPLAVRQETQHGFRYGGVGKSVHIGTMIYQDGQLYVADSYQQDIRTGQIEPLRIEILTKVRHALEQTGRDPFSFVSDCMGRVDTLASSIGAHI